MHPLSVSFYSRDFSGRLNPLAGTGFSVQSCTWKAVGGPEGARLSWHGPANAVELGQLLGLLRSPVELWGASGQRAWWGLVWSFTVQEEALATRYSLDSLANRVRVRYTNNDPASEAEGEALVTPWADDLQSQAAYGIKELELRLDVADQTQAEAYRDRQLELRASVRPNLSPSAPPSLPGKGAGGLGLSLSLECKGYWHTLNWRYYEQAAGRIENRSGLRDISQSMGVSGEEYLYQSFTPSSGGWLLDVVYLPVMAAGGIPADDIQLDLCADDAGVPGAVLASASLAGNTLTEGGFTWMKFVFSSPITVLASTLYYLLISRTGSLTWSGYYKILCDPLCAYTAGQMRRWNGSGWTAKTPDCDLQFRILGRMETTDQIALMADGECGGQFLYGVILEQESALYADPYREGLGRAGEEIEALLRAGVSGGNELVAQVNAGRYLVVRARPDSSAVSYLLGADGILRDLYGNPAAPQAGIAGCWAQVNSRAALAAGWQGLEGNRIWLGEVEWQGGVCRVKG